jgi:hypothetical protein
LIPNDDRPERILGAFDGWNRVDAFLAAWRGAGVRSGRPPRLAEDYASKRSFLEARHEQAYLQVAEVMRHGSQFIVGSENARGILSVHDAVPGFLSLGAGLSDLAVEIGDDGL